MNPSSFDPGPLYRAHLATMESRLAAALAAASLDGLVVYSGHARVPPRDDVPSPFRAEPHFLSWLPLTKLEGAALVLVPGEKPALVFPRTTDFWEAPAVEPKGFWTEHFAIRFAESVSAAGKLVAELTGRRGTTRRFAAIGEPFGGADAETAAHEPDALIAALAYARAVKTEFEAALMAEANRIAARGHLVVADAFMAGVSEFDLHQAYVGATHLREREFPYSSIIALNEHGAVLHYQHLDREAPARVLSLLIDAGAQCAGYAADVTRTWTSDDDFGTLIASLEDLQQRICGSALAGVDFVELNEETHRRLAVVLEAHGLVECSADEAFDSGVTRLFLPHGLGHLLGLQVHDVAGRQVSPAGELRPPPDDHPFLRLTRRLEPGMALTIEPGLYFIDALLDGAPPEQGRVLARERIAELAPYGGIRIEDNLIVGARASRNLTREAFDAESGRTLLAGTA